MSWSTIVLVTYMCLKWWKSSYMKNVRCDTVTLSPSLSFPFCAPLTLFPLFLGVEPLSGKFVQCCEYEQHHRISFSPPSFLKCGLPAFLIREKGTLKIGLGGWSCELHNVRIALEDADYIAGAPANLKIWKKWMLCERRSSKVWRNAHSALPEWVAGGDAVLKFLTVPTF